MSSIVNNQKTEKSSNSMKCKRLLIVFLPSIIMLTMGLILLFLSKIEAVSEYFFARGITRFFSMIIGWLTNLLPFSFSEFVVILLILICVAIITFTIVFLCKKKIKIVKRIWHILCNVLTFIFLFYVILYGGLYSRQPLPQNIGLSPKEKITTADIVESLDFYMSRLQFENKNIVRNTEGIAISPYNHKELVSILNNEYNKIDTKYISKKQVNAKKVLMSGAMSYLQITGIYIPFFAEANVNTIALDFEYITTVAHEMAHAKGIARENDASFMSYFILLNSDDSFLRYSGLVYTTNALLQELRQIDKDIYEQQKTKLPQEVVNEINLSIEANKKYVTFIGTISEFFNNLFLKANGVQEGTKSYSNTSKNIVALSEKLQEKNT